MAPRKRTARVTVMMAPDWSNLSTDTLLVISQKIVLKEQYGHFRLVCKQWRRACPPQARHLIGQVPWLMLTHDPASSTLSFHSLSRAKGYAFNRPDVMHKKICGNSRGWILFEDNGELSLINPITGELKVNCLPSLGVRYIKKFILTSSPSEEGCIVVAEFYSPWNLGFCRVGDDSWTMFNLEADDYGRAMIEDFKYKNGSVYAINDKGQVTVFDLQKFSRSILIDKLSYVRSRDHSIYLVIGKGELDGIPLAVRRVSLDVFEVYKCSRGNKWRRVRNIGKAALIINGVSEMVSLNNIRLYGWEENHVYYEVSEHGYFYSMKKVNIENGIVRDVPNSFSLHRIEPTSWFTPSMV